MKPGRIASALVIAVVGCNVPEPAQNTGGTSEPRGPCGRGVVVVSSDYVASTDVSLIAFDGRVLSASLISSASGPAGLTAPLSGDVVVPTEAPRDGRIVLIDRFPNSVLTFIDVASGHVASQLSVATGFASNPRDYVEVSEESAYVTRFEHNLKAGTEPNDAGDDVLIVDPNQPAITGRVGLEAVLAAEAGFLPRADREVAIDGRIFVVLGDYSADFTQFTAGRVVRIDTRSGALDVAELDGVGACSTIALSPKRDRIAVACTGLAYGAAATPDQSGVVVLDVERFEVVARIAASTFGPRPIGFGLDWATDATLLVVTMGSDAGPSEDVLYELDVDTGSAREVLRSTTPFVYGDVRCFADCGVCFATDSEKGVVHRFVVGQDGKLSAASTIAPDPRVGLPPRYLGAF